MTTVLHVLFTVGDSTFALPASDVVELDSFTSATRVPGAAPFVAGLVQIRGKVIPVVDLRARFKLPAKERGLDARVIVVRHGPRLVGLLADTAREVVKVDPATFQPPPEIVAREAAGFVHSVAQAGPRLFLKLDSAAVIGNDTLPQEL